jgi:hypothetical protein
MIPDTIVGPVFLHGVRVVFLHHVVPDLTVLATLDPASGKHVAPADWPKKKAKKKRPAPASTIAVTPIGTGGRLALNLGFR